MKSSFAHRLRASTVLAHAPLLCPLAAQDPLQEWITVGFPGLPRSSGNYYFEVMIKGQSEVSHEGGGGGGSDLVLLMSHFWPGCVCLFCFMPSTAGCLLLCIPSHHPAHRVLGPSSLL